MVGCILFNIVYRYYGIGDIGGLLILVFVCLVEKGFCGNGLVEIVSVISD